MLFIMHRFIIDTLPEITNFWQKFCRRNTIVSAFATARVKIKSSSHFFPNSHGCVDFAFCCLVCGLFFFTIFYNDIQVFQKVNIQYSS